MNELDDIRLVFVLGMHRSGTSAITRGLLALGVDLGTQLMESIPEINPKGFWEDMDFYRLNEEMLHVLGTDWNYSTPLTAEQITTLLAQGFLQRGMELLQNKIAQASLFGFKDPRMCRLLEFWQAVLAALGDDTAAYYLLALRNPASIADSLQKRDGLDRTQSYLMWLSYTLNAVALTMGRRRVLVEFDRMLQTPMLQLQRIAQAFDLSVDEYNAAQLYANEFLDESLCHSYHRLVDLANDTACPALVSTVYRVLRKVAADQLDWNTPEFQRQLMRWQKQLEQWRPLMACIDRLQQRSNFLSNQPSEIF